MNRLVRILLILLLFPALLSVAAGWMGAPGFLHPQKREFTSDMMRDADVTFGQIGAHRGEFDVRAADGAMLRGWKVRAAAANGSWVLVLHGVADNRYGVTRTRADFATARLRRGNDGFASTRRERRRDGDLRMAGAQGYQRGD